MAQASPKSLFDMVGGVLPMEESSPSNLTVLPGEIWVVTGPAGSGKSTLFKVMAGLIQSLDGELHLFGHDLRQISPRRLLRLRRRLGVMLEKDGLVPSWTVHECLELPWRYHQGLPTQTLDARLIGIMEQYGEEPELLGRVVATLTLEQQIRMGLLRAMQMEPELLLIDNDLVCSLLPGYFQVSFARRLQEHQCALVVRAMPGIYAILPKEAVQVAVVWKGTIVATGTRETLRRHADPLVRKHVERFG
ncbi:MAG: ATP-binding cassette domain-containing protein [Magnetococcales bacterium]|nr:ATP-binding cassette domain-containing protein [Magnetococcales bacterium]NGZ05909.1 ATP-binding cassette domain-containing protein [Magnetococcales bacterium]